MLDSKFVGVAIVCGLAIAIFASPLAAQTFVGGAQPAGCCGPTPAVAVVAVPYAVNRYSWTPSYGISSTRNPLFPAARTYGVYRVAAMPVALPGSPSAAVPVTTYRTTYRPFGSWWAARPGLFGWRNWRKVGYAPAAPVCATGCATPYVTSFASACSPCGGLTTACGPTGSSCSSGCGPITSPSSTSSYFGSPIDNGGSPALGAPETYKQQPTPAETESRRIPAPEVSTEPATTNSPQLNAPEQQTAAREIRLATYTAGPSLLLPIKKPRVRPAIDVSGWRASRD